MKRDDGSYSFGIWPREDGPSKWTGNRVEIEGQTYYLDIYTNKYYEPGGRKPEYNVVLKPAQQRQQQQGGGNSGGYNPDEIPF